uniref:Integrase catalytic domain-containing protein n=1 Tax=Podarcis muralis TaxID=64176 RepID=A0A670J1E6_PODMU
MVVVDIRTKMCHFVACSHAVTAEETAKLFVEHVFRLHGVHSRVISDRGTQFTSRFWRKLMSLLQVEVSFTTARHPETNGQAERANAVLQQYLRCYVSQRQNDWVDKLPLVEFAYNNAENVSTGMTPFFANHGCHPRAFPGRGEESWSVPAAEQFAEEMEAIHQQLQLNLGRAKEVYKREADKHWRPGETIRVGDKVWLSTQGLPWKLKPRRVGPFEVIQQVNPVAFKLRLPESMKIHPIFHRSLLSPYRGGGIRQGRGEGEVPLPETEEREQGHEVTEILDSRWNGEQLEYLVAWEGAPSLENTWVPECCITEDYLVEEFHDLFPNKPKPPGRFFEQVFGPTDDEEDFKGFPPSDDEGRGRREGHLKDRREPAGLGEGWGNVFEDTEDEDEIFLGFTPEVPDKEETGMTVSPEEERGAFGEGVDVRELEAEKGERMGTYREKPPLISSCASSDKEGDEGLSGGNESERGRHFRGQVTLVREEGGGLGFGSGYAGGNRKEI